jgi:hypothetical protein
LIFAAKTMAMYRIGPADLFTPGDLAADANTLNGQINALDDQDWSKPAQNVFDGWMSFVSEWRAFYSSSFGGFFTNLTTAINDANRDQLIQFEQRFANWANTYSGASGNQLPGGVINVSTGSQDTLGAQIVNQLQPLIPSLNIKNVLIVAAIGGVVLAILYREPLSRLAGKVV